MEGIKRQLLLLFLSIVSNYLHAQKPAIDSSVFDRWPILSGAQFTNNGQFLSYINGHRLGDNPVAIIEATRYNWKTELRGFSYISFTHDSRQYIAIKNDSIRVGKLGHSDTYFINNVSISRIFNQGDDTDWLVYSLKCCPNELIIRNLNTGSERKISLVGNYWLNPQNKTLVVERNLTDFQQLQWIDLSKFNTKKIWEGKGFKNLVVSKSGNEIAFIANASENEPTPAIFYFSKNSLDAIKIAGKNSLPDNHYKIVELEFFSGNASRLFFSVRWQDSLKSHQTLVPVDVWSYKDAKLQPLQLFEKQNPQLYTALVNISDKKIVLLEDKATRILSPITESTGEFEYWIVRRFNDGGEGPGDGEGNWNIHNKATIDLISLSDGSLQRVKCLTDVKYLLSYAFSPDGKYFVYYDPIKKNYFSYNISSHNIKNLTWAVSGTWTTFARNDEPDAKYLPIGIGGFINNETVLLYDQHDVFKACLTGSKLAVCMTEKFGKIQNIVFRIAETNNFENLVPHNGGIILNAFDRTNKKDGFYSIQVRLKGVPRYLYMGPYIFDGPDESRSIVFSPIKARDSDIFIVRKMSASQSPNYFLTTDFKTFHCVSDSYPEEKYNWMTSELVNWKTPQGKKIQGILYKPENFDASKKYPVIINYYEKVSETLNEFLEPDYIHGGINVPFYASNGYLVFTPDIHFRLGLPGKSSYDCVSSGLKYLERRSYIDKNHIGLQGHSWGGFQTNYIIAHSHLFAAAASGSGMSDFVSAYGSIIKNGISRQAQYELRRDRMGGTLWDIPVKYIENSPVLKANCITTPLLMLADKEDDDVPFQQGVELFTALRRLGKKAWMLQYDGEGHVPTGAAAKDYTIRMKQFFDYYLKGALPPVWMTRGVPAILKNVDSGLELDESGIKP